MTFLILRNFDKFLTLNDYKNIFFFQIALITTYKELCVRDFLSKLIETNLKRQSSINLKRVKIFFLLHHVPI